MFWQEQREEKSFTPDNEVLDLQFKLKCSTLPLDHAWSLCSALKAAAPWIETSRHTAIHLIHGAESGNGWMRPDDAENAVLHLSRRARFTLRLHRDQLPRAEQLVNLELDIDGHSLRSGEFKKHLLLPQATVFARHVVTREEISEEEFLQALAPIIQAKGITIRKMMGGRRHRFKTPDGYLTARSLMISDLDREESILLQRQGIGEHQLLGMGIFLPHKGIAPVKDIDPQMLPPGYEE